MKSLAFILLVLVSFGATAQQDYYVKLEQSSVDHANSGEYSKSLDEALELYYSYPENVGGHVLIAFNLINLNRYKEAGGYLNAALSLDPTSYSAYIITSYYYFADGKIDDAKFYLTESIKTMAPNASIEEAVTELRTVGKNTGKQQQMEQLISWYRGQVASIKERYPTLQGMLSEFNQNGPNMRDVAEKYAAQFSQRGWHDMAIMAYTYAASWYRQLYYPSEAIATANAGYNYYLKNGFRDNPTALTFLYYELIQTTITIGNDEKAIQYVDEALRFSEKLVIHAFDVKILNAAANSYGRLQKNDQQRQYASAAFQLAQKNGYGYGVVTACIALSNAFGYLRFDGDTENSIYYGEQALELGIKYHYEDLLNPIMSNLAIAYYRVGTREAHEKGIRMQASVLKIQKDKQLYADAALTLNNMGAIMYFSGGYDYAAQYFEESIQLAEIGIQNIKAEYRLNFFEAQISAYQWLAACYAHLEQPEKAFRAMEGSRSRVLTERLSDGKKVKPAELSDLQRMLKPDEAAIMYSLFSAHEVIILVVTKKYARVLFNKDDNFIGDIKDKYLDRMNKEHRERSGQEREEKFDRDQRVQMADFQKVTQLTRKFFERPGMADDVLREYLQGYYRFLMVPILNRLNGIKELLISPDNVLNFIPFEALQQHDGKYLIEKYNVRYLNSTGALQLIEERKYAESRKPLLAMGGAVYEQMNIQRPAINTQADLNALEAEVDEFAKTGHSQRKAYAALFGTDPLNPLPGTLEEVKKIASNVPSSQVFTGKDMSEARLKAMSKSGELSKFKVVHLATHGFVVEDIPALSGIAMSIAPTEQDGEDGFLNVNELAALNMNADLAVLSACQTALGKIYSGEGVTGLTQSLLLSGANAALVSLWPVNDTSTMLFMSTMYKEAAKGKSYPVIVAEMKRKFIKGEFGDEFKHPNFWAPFVYIGQ